VAIAGLDIDAQTDANGDVTLKLGGELDVDSVSALERAAKRCLSADAVTLDLSGLTFIDSTGLASIALVSRLRERDGRALKLVPGPPAVQRLFEITGLIDALPFVSAERARS
jgi:anti-sigma B factor antagonist